MGRAPATAEKIVPEPAAARPAAPRFADEAPEPAPEPAAPRRLLGAVLALAIALSILVAFALAHIYPALAPTVAAATLAIVAFGLWGAARVDTRTLRDDVARLGDDNAALTAQIESLADTAWELRESEELYRSLVDAQGDLVVRRDAAGAVTFANPAFVSAFGDAASDIVGRPLAFAPTLAPPPPGAVVARDVKLDTAAGPRWYAWVDIRVRDEFYSVARDVTARKDVEQALVDARVRAEAASQAKSRVLATVSHEFRTPLNGILGLTGLLRETELTPDQETYARAVHSSGEALLALVDDMLDFSKIEAGRLDIKPEPTDVEALLQEIAELLAGRAHVKGIDVAVAIDPALPASVMVDPARLRQVLINLAGNGVKFTDTGGVTLSAAVGADDTLVFTVADTGPGIPEEEGARLFDEFEQMDTAPSRRHGGAGLGLAISRRIVRRMGGDVKLSPRDGGGSVFSFALKLPVVDGGGQRPAVDLAGQSFLILAPAGAEPPVLARHLADAGATARVAVTLAEAAGLIGAATAAGESHDAVFVDGRIGLDPAAALARIREAAGAAVPAAVLIEPGRRGDVEHLRARRLRRLSGAAGAAEFAASRRRRHGRRDPCLPDRPGRCRTRQARNPAPRQHQPRGAAGRGQRDQRAACPRGSGRAGPHRHRGP